MLSKRVTKWIGVITGPLLIIALMGSLAFAAEEKVHLKVVYPFLGSAGISSENWPDNPQEAFTIPNAASYWLGTYTASMFMMANPDIELELVGYGGPWQTQLAAGEATANQDGGTWSVAEYAEMGLCADITEYVLRDWDKYGYKNLPKVLLAQCMYKGRYYALPEYEANIGALVYRKDWFKEAGIFDAEGMAGPPTDWTLDDFQEIATKLTNPKEKRWGWTVKFQEEKAFENMLTRMGLPLVRPDPTGEYTWRSAFNSPESLEAAKFFRDAIWKYENCLYGMEQPDPKRVNFQKAGLTAMAQWNWVYGMSRYIWFEKNVGHDTMGLAALPTGLGGLRTDAVSSGAAHWLNPLLNKEEMDAAWEWMAFLCYGPGAFFQFLTGYGSEPVGGMYAGHYAFARAIEMSIPPIEAMIPEWSREVLNEGQALPSTPDEREFGIVPPVQRFHKELAASMQVLYSKNLSDAELQAELDKAAKMIDNSVLNYKTEGVGNENFKNYYDALKEFYQKNYPEYYKDYFSKQYEEYYKVW